MLKPLVLDSNRCAVKTDESGTKRMLTMHGMACDTVYRRMAHSGRRRMERFRVHPFFFLPESSVCAVASVLRDFED